MEDNLEDILIYSDQEYHPSEHLQQLSVNLETDRQENELKSKQLVIVEQKYQKYKRLRKLLREGYTIDATLQQSINQISSQSSNSSNQSEQSNSVMIDEDEDKQQSQSRVTLVPTESMLNKSRLEVIKQLKLHNPQITVNQICLELNKRNHLKENKFGKFKDISRTVVIKLLNQLPFSQKTRLLHPDRNKQQFVELRHIFCKLFLQRLQSQACILFVDQHSFKLFQAGRDSLWVDPSLEQRPSNPSDDQFSLLTCFSLRGEAYFKISKLCAQKYDDYLGFGSLMNQALADYHETRQKAASVSQFDSQSQQTNKKVCLIMDNIILHNKAKQRKYKQISQGEVILLPQFSPQLNPIEQWFLKLRQRIRKNTYVNSWELCQGVHSILKEQQNYNYQPIINEAIEQIKRGYARGRF